MLRHGRRLRTVDGRLSTTDGQTTLTFSEAVQLVAGDQLIVIYLTR
ncbi:hypothetical protein [Fodinicola feengrottensis]|nr:hypothetical protein [Fodinicola feengrottensis]